MWLRESRALPGSRSATAWSASSRRSGGVMPRATENRRRKGYFGAYGGQFAPETLMAPLEELEKAFARFRKDRRFKAELSELLRTYAGRPTPLSLAENLSAKA